MLRFIAPALTFCLCACAAAPSLPVPEKIDEIDLSRFAGEWFVVAALPDAHRGEVGRRLAVATREGGGLDLRLRWFEGSFAGREQQRNGHANLLDVPANARWKVSFDWTVPQEWLVLYIDEGYRVALIGNAARSLALVLARERYLPDLRLFELRDRLAVQGYDVRAMLKVPQGQEFVGMPGFFGAEP